MNDTREHILRTSLKLFLQKNFKEVTMKEIVEHTKLSKGAFYHYFNSKEQVFEEVIEYFYADFMDASFDSYNHDSLAAFFKDYLNDIENKVNSARIVDNEGKVAFSANHYFLLFDAPKMLPSFKEKMLDHDMKELNGWKKIIKIAKKNKEIKTTMSDEQVAKMFIYMSDGFGIRLLLTEGMENFVAYKSELMQLFNGIYNLLKA
ncbi:MAG: TetR/AcrR family transcriptional regulator [Flavipsychrobacter sp.]